MKNTKIYYYQFEGDGYIPSMLDSPLSLDGVGFEPTRYIEEVKGNTTYYECPAWQHKAVREFVIRSVRDITLEIDTKNGIINAPNVRPDQFHKYVHQVRSLEVSSTLQLPIPMFLFWTKEKNVWVELKPYPLTVLNNYVTVGGWFNLSQWTRPLSFAVDFIDPKKPVVIKRGDPIYKVCFYKENDLSRNFMLEKRVPEKDFLIDIQKRIALKDVIPNISKNLLFGINSKKESKCPFSFLFKDKND